MKKIGLRGLRAAFVLALLVSSGCITTPIHMSASTRPVDMDSMRVVGEVKGTAWNGMWYVFGWGPEDPVGKAINDATRSAAADSLIDVTAEQDHVGVFGFPFFVFLFRTTVRGTAVRKIPQPSEAHAIGYGQDTGGDR